ncbi:MAG: hypothetical protein ACPLX8_02060, partial [Nanopusillaceae archaeon]
LSGNYESTIYIDYNNATDEFGILGNSTSFIVDLSNNPNSTNMESQTVEITTNIRGFRTSIQDTLIDSINLKQIDSNLWFAFNVSQNIPTGNVLYLNIPNYDPSLQYILESPASQVPVKWSILNINGSYKLFINGPIFKDSKFVLYGYNSDITKIVPSNNYVYV